MIDVEKLKMLCSPINRGKAYYRPFDCEGDLSKVDIFLAGINPATPIYPEEMDINNYIDMLLNYDKFMEFYKFSRTKAGKDEISRTRIGMKSFINYLKEHTSSTILETDVIPYPTESVKLLNKEPKEIIERGKEIFYELVMGFQPKLIILHGKKAVENVYDIFVSGELIKGISFNVDLLIEDMESLGPLCRFKYPNGKECSIMACRHFMYYGNSGNSFEGFRNRVLAQLNILR